jgi:predicted transcriptional regulator
MSESPTILVAFRLPVDELHRLDDLGKAQHRNRSEMIRRAVGELIAREQVPS